MVSVFCLTTEEHIAKEVSELISGKGTFFKCGIDPQGARVLPAEKAELPELTPV